MQSLDVCLHGERIGALERTADGGYELAYAPAVVARHGAGSVLLSHSLPVRSEPYSADTTRSYVEGLLPQGRARRRVAGELGIDPADGYGLIGALGYDCPGAVTFGGGGGGPRKAAAGSTVALGGDREKLALVRHGLDGPWQAPGPGLPSTHVIKPEPDDRSEIVANEMFCTSSLRQAGLPVAKATMETIDGRRCLVSPRFDVAWRGATPQRLHQETFCQALGIPPDAGSGAREAGAPGFAEASGLLRAVGLEREVATLVHAAFGNYVLGNGDSHGRNFALLFRDGRMALAIYDVTSTVVYDDSAEAGMALPDDLDVTTYLRALRRVAEECGTGHEIFHIQASCALKYMCDAIEIVAERAEAQGWYAPVIDRIFEIARTRAGRCAERLLLWDHLDL
ncbi:MAG TPA: HipA domain-containing protein [Solirubrobacterales bacterium]|nr:HipA domain-containing protein [Solirubrobacterales bacterium]